MQKLSEDIVEEIAGMKFIISTEIYTALLSVMNKLFM